MRIRKPVRLWPYLIPLLIMIVILALLFLSNVSRPGHDILGCPEGCASPAKPSDGPIKVMTFNMLHGYPGHKDLERRLDLIAEEIRRLKPDIVALQEVPWTRQVGDGASNLAQATAMNYLSLRANGNRSLIGFEEGLLILSRFALAKPSFVELEPRAGFFEHRVALAATAQTPQGDLDIVVTHLTNGDPEVNQKQVLNLLDFVEERRSEPGIILGDFNADEHSPQISALSERWMDIYRIIHPARDGLTCCLSELRVGPGESLETRIDYAFLFDSGRQDVRVLDIRPVFDRPIRIDEGWQWTSDHVGLLATIEFVP